ncbi:MAG: HAD family hydrolase [Planctomycetota bacterium]|nr:HAD family hydrolase [Planctomycetota bacterium]
MPRYRAVFLDFGNTLAPENPVPLPARLRRTCAERFPGLRLSLPDEDAALQRLHRSCSERAGWPVHPETNEGYEAFYTRWARALLEALGLPAGESEQVAAEFGEAFRDLSDSTRVPYPDCVETLDRLARAGCRLAVISNNDGRLLRRMTYMGLAGRFELIADSSIVRSSKPDAGIFMRGLEGLGVAPAEVLHVGDLYGPDVIGAGRLGIDAAWLRRGDPEPAEPSHAPKYVIEQLAELPALVG